MVLFANGIRKIINCKQLMHLAPYKALTNEAFFRSVKVDSGRCGVSWDDAVDLSEHELWVNSEEAAPVGLQHYRRISVRLARTPVENLRAG